MKKTIEPGNFYQKFMKQPAARPPKKNSDFAARPKQAAQKRFATGYPGKYRAPTEMYIRSSLFPRIPAEMSALLADFDKTVQSVLPLSPARYAELPRQIRQLSHNLTDDRSSRNSGYMNTPATATAYIRYFMWWNLVRLVHLFSGLSFDLKDGSYAADIGSGPLTAVCALWIAHPELRTRNITWYCVDVSSSILSSGEEIFLSLAAKTGGTPWKIIRIKGSTETELRHKVSLVTCANMMNELFWDNKDPMEMQAKQQVTKLTGYCGQDGAVLVIEPGIPRSARFVSLMRDSFMKRNFRPMSPCPHTAACPLNGAKGGKWCHFVFPAERAPAALQKRSADSGLPKERLALSFLYVSRNAAPSADPELTVRVASDEIRLPGNRIGRYGCSCDGLVLLEFRKPAATPESGTLVALPGDSAATPAETDVKTGARRIACTAKDCQGL